MVSPTAIFNALLEMLTREGISRKCFMAMGPVDVVFFVAVGFLAGNDSALIVKCRWDRGVPLYADMKVRLKAVLLGGACKVARC